MTTSQYTEYFENLAAAHKDIRHTKGAHKMDAGIGENRFATYNADDVISKTFRTKIGFPALMAEMFEFNFNGSSVYDPKMMHRGAFSVICKANHRDLYSEQEALDQAEAILWDCIQQLYADHYGPNKDRCLTPFQFVDVQNAQAMPFGPIWDFNFGWRFEFSFRPKLTRKLTDAPPTGTFIT